MISIDFVELLLAHYSYDQYPLVEIINHKRGLLMYVHCVYVEQTPVSSPYTRGCKSFHQVPQYHIINRLHPHKRT